MQATMRPVVFSKWKGTISRKAGGSSAMADFCSDGRPSDAWFRESEEPSCSPAQAPRCAVGPGMALSIRPKTSAGRWSHFCEATACEGPESLRHDLFWFDAGC